MTVIEKIKNSLITRKMSIDEKIEYLKILKDRGINLNKVSKEYETEDGVIVYNVISNLKKFYDKGKLSIRQIIEAEKLGIKFDEKYKSNEEKIKFLIKALEENINLSNITCEYEKYKDTTIFMFINDIRKEAENNKLTKEQLDICINRLCIILPKEKKEKIIMKKIKDGVLQYIMQNDEIKKILN